jgi:pimeloyl-ACP methyl ester carboxylesterase
MFQRGHREIRWPALAALLVSGLVGSGCVLVRTRANAVELGTAADLFGSVLSEGEPHALIRLVLVQWDGRIATTVAQRVMWSHGSFHFICRHGRYALAAFEDLNDDGKWEPGEPLAWVGGRGGLQVSEGVEFHAIDLRLTASAESPPFIPTALEETPIRRELVAVHLGDRESLAVGRFSPEQGALGYWQPVDFARENGIGVSLLEDYQPEKTPVLFIHGASGSPRDFQYLIEHLDRTRYQPWVYSYPSGLRLELSAYTLARVLDEMHHRLGFSHLVIVAHSMGGLVARGAVDRVMSRSTHRYVDQLITLSTPWGGHEDAGVGIQRSPVVVPVWHDMAAGSAYLSGLFAQQSAEPVPFFLLYSFEGRRTSGRNADGTISLQSQLDPRAQREALQTFGFPVDHAGILHDEAVAETLAEVMGRPAIAR